MSVKNIDVFNGDADGITALIQYRLQYPDNSRLVTGVKRDIRLLSLLEAKLGDSVVVLDISKEKNAKGLQQILAAGARVLYIDHHNSGEPIEHENLTAIIETSPEVCTSLLMNGYLNNAYPEWAVVGAFGDNLKNSARKLAESIGLDEPSIEKLERLGIAINYNGYGPTIDALHFDPAYLFKELVQYQSPLDTFKQGANIVNKLMRNYDKDMELASSVKPLLAESNIAVYELPNEPWALRVSGVFGNDLANQFPERAHAILSINQQGGYQVSVRAPAVNKSGADELCLQFATGGGRKGAAGINHLLKEDLDRFTAAFRNQYS